MGAFDGELYLLGFRSPACVKEKKVKITHGLCGPLTCFIARVYVAGRSQFTTEGYIVALSKKWIKRANEDTNWPNAVKETGYSRRYVYYYDKKDAERVVIDQESFQAIYKNFKDHDVGYAFVKSVSALKLENLSRTYR